jgi:hypothetical protein
MNAILDSLKRTDVQTVPLETVEVSPWVFWRLVQTASCRHKLDDHDIKGIKAKEDAGFRFYAVHNERAGYSVGPDGELSLMFNASTKVGLGRWLVRDAIRKGATHGNFFDDGFLGRLYVAGGFELGERVPFDPAQAPAGWPEEAGTPDVVFYHLPKNVC